MLNVIWIVQKSNIKFDGIVSKKMNNLLGVLEKPKLWKDTT